MRLFPPKNLRQWILYKFARQCFNQCVNIRDLNVSDGMLANANYFSSVDDLGRVVLLEEKLKQARKILHEQSNWHNAFNFYLGLPVSYVPYATDWNSLSGIFTNSLDAKADESIRVSSLVDLPCWEEVRVDAEADAPEVSYLQSVFLPRLAHSYPYDSIPCQCKDVNQYKAYNLYLTNDAAASCIAGPHTFAPFGCAGCVYVPQGVSEETFIDSHSRIRAVNKLKKLCADLLQEALGFIQGEISLLGESIRRKLANWSRPSLHFSTENSRAWFLLHGPHPPREIAETRRSAFDPLGRASLA